MITYNSLKKNLKKDTAGFKKIRLAIVADSASQLIHQSIKGYGIEYEMDFEVYEADYDQVDMQVFDTSSELYGFSPEFILINFSAEHLLKSFYASPSESRMDFAENKINHIRSIIETLTTKSGAKIILNTFLEINDSVFGNYASKTQASYIYQVRKINLMLMDISRDYKNVFISDLALLQSQNGRGFTFDSKLYISADMVYSIDFLPLLAKSAVDIIQALSGNFKKCLVLDLDNTTWGGIIGDDGMEGIQVGDLGIGKAFTELQSWAKQLKERGIILAVSSKNSEEIAKEPFLNHPDMVLKLDDFAVFNANWENKVDNIRHIQSVLNIGFDSIVFLDDNPFERAIVKNGIPELTVPELPEDPAEYLPYLRTLNLFETASFTEEDHLRTKQYQEEAKRNTLQKTFANEGAFLENLEMKSTVSPFNKFTIPRVAQLTQRSNQFNLRTVRYTEEEIGLIANNPDYATLTFSLEDKFGDHGLICIIILKKLNEKEIFIDSWIMSCRVLKRGMEEFTLNTIVSKVKELGFESVIGEYLPTRKNGIVKDHYLNLGFAEAGDKWRLKTDKFEEKNNFIKTETAKEVFLEG